MGTWEASYQGGELVRAGIADLLRGGGAVQPEELVHVVLCVLSPSRSDGTLDGKEDGGGQEEGRLPDSLSGQSGGRGGRAGNQTEGPQPPQQEGWGCWGTPATSTNGSQWAKSDQSSK